MIDFENKEYLKLKESDNDEYADLINGILVSGESIIHTYKSVRDGLVFTNRRLIAINIQGITGKKKTITILPYDRVQAFSVETAGVIDLDSGETGDMIFNKYDAVNSDLDDPEEPELLPEELELLKKLDAEEE